MRIFCSSFLSLLLPIVFLSFAVPQSCRAQSGLGALVFDNTDFTTGGDFVYFPHHDFGLTDEVTVAIWVRWDAQPNGPVSNPHEPTENKWANLVSMDYHDAVNGGQFWLQHNSGNTKFEWIVQTAGTRQSIQSSTVPQQGKWYHLVGVYDGSPSQGNTSMRLYVNGVEEATANTSTISGNIKAHDGRVRLNLARIPSDYRLFTGCMDELRLWKRALTREEIRKQMHSSSTVNPDLLLAFYPMNSSSGSTVADSTGTLDGTFYTALIDVHSASSGLCLAVPFANFTITTPWKIADADKNWSASNFAGMPTRTVAGTGIDQVNLVLSNDCNTLTLQRGWSGTGIDSVTVPVVDGQPADTWLGIEDAGQTSQWQDSDIPVAETWAYITGTTGVAIGSTGAQLQTTITSVPDSTNNALSYTYGSTTDPPVTTEVFPIGVNSRIPLVWGSRVFGSAALVLEFQYSAFAGVPSPSTLTLLRRTSPSDAWTAVPATGLTNNTLTRTFTLTGVNAGYEYSIGSASGVNPLPVELVTFEGRRKAGSVELRWETATELNSQSFEIEGRESSQGAYANRRAEWSRLAVLPAAGNSASPRQYAWTHSHPQSSAMEYRLRMLDRDGTSRYSQVLRVPGYGMPEGIDLRSYPNPARGQMTIEVTLADDTPVLIRLCDMLGRVRSIPVDEVLKEGKHIRNIGLQDLKSGMYMLELITPSGARAVRFSVLI